MKPTPHTIQWLAPTLSDGEVQALYEAVLKDVIGKDKGWPISQDVNNEKFEQRAALNRLFGKEN
jgi:hypothetical protein